MSKSTKKSQGCTHKFVQGTKKGKKCNKPCRGKFCFSHKPKTKERKAKYYQEKREKEKDYELKELLKQIKNCENIEDLPLLEQYEDQLRKLTGHYNELLRKYFGYRKKLGYDDLEEINKQYEKLNPVPKYIKQHQQIYQDWFMNCMPRMRPAVTEYYGEPSKAKKKLKANIIQKDLIIDQIRFNRIIIKAIKKKIEELE